MANTLQTLEIIAVVLVLISMVLEIKQNKWYWAICGVSVVIYTYLCYMSHLYLETGLQVFYLVMSVIGFFSWQNIEKQNAKKVISLTFTQYIFSFLAVGALSVLVGFIFKHFTTTAMPWLDAPITVCSLFATFLSIKKVIQNWHYWIGINAACIFLYYQRGLELTSYLYMLYVILSFIGYFAWKKELKN